MPRKQINKKTNVNSGADQEQDDIMTNPAYSELWQDGILQRCFGPLLEAAKQSGFSKL